MKKLRVGLCYNLYKDFPKQKGHPEDIGVEWSDENYVTTLKDNLNQTKYTIVDIGNPLNLLDKTTRSNIDVIFSIAEMLGYRYREGLVASLCELLEIPYTFSTPDVMAIAADKHLTNLFVQNLNIKVPKWHFVTSLKDLYELKITNYPYIIKPVAEGSSMGISNNSIIWNDDDLLLKAKNILKKYEQPIIVQKFIQGTEITIGIIQKNNKIIPLAPLVILDNEAAQFNINTFENKMYNRMKNTISIVQDEILVKKIQKSASEIFVKMGCRDTARIDFRLDLWGEPYFIEINPLTDYTENSDFSKSAIAAGVSNKDLLEGIILNAWERGFLKQNLKASQKGDFIE